MISKPASLAATAYSDGTIWFCASVLTRANMGGAITFSPCVTRPGRLDVALAYPSGVSTRASRYTAWQPNSGSFLIQYRTSSNWKDCGQTRRGSIPAALYSSMSCCAYCSWVYEPWNGIATSGALSSGLNCRWSPRPSTMAICSWCVMRVPQEE